MQHLCQVIEVSYGVELENIGNNELQRLRQGLHLICSRGAGGGGCISRRQGGTRQHGARWLAGASSSDLMGMPLSGNPPREEGFLPVGLSLAAWSSWEVCMWGDVSAGECSSLQLLVARAPKFVHRVPPYTPACNKLAERLLLHTVLLLTR